MAEAALHNETVAGVRHLRELLADVPWLASLSTTERDGLLEMSERRTLASREWLFRQESPAEWLYIVITGGLRLVRAAGDGREATIRCVERGGTLGELSMVSPAGRYLYSAEALKRCQVLALPTAACRDVLDNHPSCRAEYLGRLAMELTERLEDLALLTKADAMSRLVSFLLRQLPRSSRPGPRVVRLSVPRCWLAEQLAMTPETLSRLLARLREQGAIDADRRRLVILDEGKLRRLLLEAG
ncbi:Crp/Fnr family transcriptional regulator [Litchfieldella xinjiangensis]|uniref:Crp/Fnr family transcriptional regulator n=1 Tax=Litchfieldella xinjiangensis TaxID=1166948 RepID=UPI0005BD324D|nr:Crp/Fnr family transcriptional regulator [Halomonas xinjiangensis]